MTPSRLFGSNRCSPENALPRLPIHALVALLGLAPLACQGEDPPMREPGDVPAIVSGSPQEPPRGQPSMEAWLARGHYKSWRCEQQIFPPRGNGVHGRHRICANDALLASTSGMYPVGAASVKELFFGADDRPNGFAVGIKVAPGAGASTWYWYSRVGSLATLRPNADSVGDMTCAGCHVLAPRDNVFIRPE
jgi:hypothetical protein